MKGKTKAELARELGRATLEMRNNFRQFIQLKIRENNINISFEMLEIMAILWEKDGINQQELADIIVKDKSSMTYLIDNLGKRNMVERSEDPADRRNKLIYLTSKGRTLKDELHPWVIGLYTAASAGLEKKDVEAGLILINRMIENIKKEIFN